MYVFEIPRISVSLFPTSSHCSTKERVVIKTVIPISPYGNFEPYGRDFEGGLPTGRFSNGRIPPDFISEAFGIKPTVPAYLDPIYNITDFASGVCFASAGTGYDNATSDVLSVIPLWEELKYYKDYQKKLRAYFGEEKANDILSEALYLMSLGTNDFLENYYTFFSDRSPEFTVEEYQRFLAGIAGKFITELYNEQVKEAIDPFCYRECSDNYGTYECNIDCCNKRHPGGRCLPKTGLGVQHCCCDP
ncbi:hypothetical protein HHK36_003216 [Tetracentron sinense]|uniref:Defensin-like domain-containing protein n=1 Tax=Tetracentron sinense TaxID=13715 RepID=A0A835DNG0_TETSI|nr:hypothetical protein HHK36_003216 [Tetracentron sinense]